MFQSDLCGLSGFSIVQGPIDVNALRTTFEKSMSKNIVDAVMLVIPYDRDNSPIAVIERSGFDCLAVGTLNISFGRPSSENILKLLPHFDFPPPL